MTVADTDMIEIFFDGQDSIPQQIDAINYLNRFIVRNEDDFYKINFSSFSNFQSLVKDYTTLHQFNTRFYNSLIEDFHKDLPKDTDKLNVKLPLVRYELIEPIRKELSQYTTSSLPIFLAKHIEYMEWDSELEKLIITINPNFYSIFQEDKEIESLFSNWLYTNFNKYTGPFEFDSGLPF